MKTKPLRLFVVAVAFVALATGCGKAPSSGPEEAGQPAAPTLSEGGSPSLQTSTHGGTTSPANAGSATELVAEKPLPRLVDIGAGTCIPCRMMKPILDELMATRAHQFETVFVDLGREREKAMGYRIRVIPTQVFFDENRRELGRHEGFMSKELILKTWEELGYRFEAQ